MAAAEKGYFPYRVSGLEENEHVRKRDSPVALGRRHRIGSLRVPPVHRMANRVEDIHIFGVMFFQCFLCLCFTEPIVDVVA